LFDWLYNRKIKIHISSVNYSVNILERKNKNENNKTTSLNLLSLVRFELEALLFAECLPLSSATGRIIRQFF